MKTVTVNDSRLCSEKECILLFFCMKVRKRNEAILYYKKMTHEEIFEIFQECF